MAATEMVFMRRLNGSIFYLTLAAAAVLLITTGWAMWSADFSPVGVVVFVVCVIFSWWLLMMRVTLTISDREVKVSVLGMFSERLPLATIDDVVPGPETAIREGVGVRFVGNDMGYLVGGDTVRIIRSRQSLLVSVNSPNEVIQAINQVRA